MFNTVIQPTGIYGTYPGLARNPNNNGSTVQTTDPAKSPVKKSKINKRTIALTALAVTGIAIAITWTLPALRSKYFGGDFADRHFEDIFEKPSDKLPMLDPLRKAFVKTADFLDEKIKSPVSGFLRENLLKFKHDI